MGVFRVGVDEKGLSLCIELINGKDLGEKILIKKGV